MGKYKTQPNRFGDPCRYGAVGIYLQYVLQVHGFDRNGYGYQPEADGWQSGEGDAGGGFCRA